MKIFCRGCGRLLYETDLLITADRARLRINEKHGSFNCPNCGRELSKKYTLRGIRVE